MAVCPAPNPPHHATAGRSSLPSPAAAHCEDTSILTLSLSHITHCVVRLTSVGATTGISPETAASLSGGGFSNIFARPSYQDNAVTTYLNALGTTYSGKYNQTGRAYPDVSTQGQHYVIVANSTGWLVDGTSASSPTFAGVIALLNNARIAAGKSLLGFLNPALYANPGIFNDITSGSNPGCGTDGFPARAGWDPVRRLFKEDTSFH